MVMTGKVEGDVGKLAVFAGVHKFPARVKCAILVLARRHGGAERRGPAGEHGKRRDLIDFTRHCGEDIGSDRLEVRYFMNSNEAKNFDPRRGGRRHARRHEVTLQKGEQAYITQSLGGSYTVIVNGNMFRIEGKDADALGFEVAAQTRGSTGGPVTQEQLEKEIWEALKTATTRKSRSTSLTSA